VGWKLSSEGRGIISGGNYEGFSASSNSEPEIKLNLTTPWVFFVEKEALSDLENGATGTLLYIRNSETSSDKRVDDVEEFFYNFSSFEPSKGVKQSTGQREDLLVPDLEYQVEAEPKAAKKNFFGTLSKKKQKNIPPAREPELPASDSTDW
jgi:hypothetical protein